MDPSGGSFRVPCWSKEQSQMSPSGRLQSVNGLSAQFLVWCAFAQPYFFLFPVVGSNSWHLLCQLRVPANACDSYLHHVTENSLPPSPVASQSPSFRSDTFSRYNFSLQWSQVCCPILLSYKGVAYLPSWGGRHNLLPTPISCLPHPAPPPAGSSQLAPSLDHASQGRSLCPGPGLRS